MNIAQIVPRFPTKIKLRVFEFSLIPSLSPGETGSQYGKTHFSEKGERRSGGKDLER
jgi:hypothetical protein